jgi:hypothetical protein
MTLVFEQNIILISNSIIINILIKRPRWESNPD